MAGWTLVGSELNLLPGDYSSGLPSAAVGSNILIGYWNGSSNVLREYAFNGSTWSAVAASVPYPAWNANHEMAPYSATKVVVHVNQFNRLYPLTTSGTLGSFTSTNVRTFTKMADGVYVGLVDTGTSQTRVQAYSFDGTTISLIGAPLLINETVPVQGDLICRLDDLRVVAQINNGDIRVYLFDGNTFTEEATYSTGYVFYSLENAGDGRFAAADPDSKIVQMHEYDYGTNTISELEAPFPIAATDSQYTTLSYLDSGLMALVYSEISSPFGIYLQALSFESTVPVNWWERLQVNVTQGAS